MSLKETIETEYKNALKSKDKSKISTYRLILSSIKDLDISNRSGPNKKETDDEDIKKLLKKMIKQRNESVEIYKKNKREDLLKIEQGEIDLLSTYLPKQLSEEEIRLKADSLNSLINTIHPSALSQRFDANEIVKQHFPGADKISWDIGPDYKKDASKKRIEQILEANTDLKLFLVRFETASYR